MTVAALTPPARIPALTTMWRGAFRVWRREALVYSHLARWLLIPNVADPILMLGAFGLGLGAYLSDFGGENYVAFIAPGLVASSVMWTASFESTWNVTMKIQESHTYDGMIATPVEPADAVIGSVAWGATRATFTATIFLVIAAAFGLIDSWWAVLIPAVCFPLGLVFSALGFLAASVITSVAYWAYYFALGIMPMFLLSGIFFPLDEWPLWAQRLALFMPLYQGARLCRSLATGDLGWADVAGIAYLAVVTVFLTWAAIRLFRRRLVV